MDHELKTNSGASGRDDLGGVLVDACAPFLCDKDEAGLLGYLRRSWTIGELAGLLQGSDSTVGRVAAYALGIIGGPVAVMPLARALYHDNAAIVAAVEDGLWRIWFDEFGVGVRRELRRAAALIGDGRYSAALGILGDVVARHPNFAEAYNQRAIARCLGGDHVGAVADCKAAVALNSNHFGAQAGMGDNHAQLGQYHEALTCYRAALKIHPRMAGVRQSMRRVKAISRSPYRVS